MGLPFRKKQVKKDQEKKIDQYKEEATKIPINKKDQIQQAVIKMQPKANIKEKDLVKLVRKTQLMKKDQTQLKV